MEYFVAPIESFNCKLKAWKDFSMWIQIPMLHKALHHISIELLKIPSLANILNFTKNRRQFAWVEKSSWGCYHLDPVGASLKGLPFSITWVVHCGHCLCLSFLTSSSKLLYFTFVLFPQGSRCWERKQK